MADKPKDPKPPLPQRVVPQKRTMPFDPDEIYDMKLGPGDHAVQAAYARTNRATTFLGPLPSRAATEATDQTPDALMIQRRARRARSLTFTVQGILWRAGFAPDLAQTPLGQATPFRKLTDSETASPSGAILRPCEAVFEMVFRELIPKPLIDQADSMFGLVRKLDRISLYYFPAGDGATAGVMATYAEQPASRGHVLYLQTNIKQASPSVLEQINKTFAAAVPKALEAAKQPAPGGFWQEVDKATYQLTATFRNSVLGGNTQAATKQLRRSVKQAGQRVDRAVSWVETIGRSMDRLASAPGRLGVAVVRGITGFLIKVIEALDKIAGRPST